MESGFFGRIGERKFRCAAAFWFLTKTYPDTKEAYLKLGRSSIQGPTRCGESVVKKTLVVAVLLGFAAPAFAQAADSAAAPAAAKGKMLVAADGARLGSIYRVSADGPQLIVDGRMVTVPGNTIAVTDGKITTSLTKREVIALP
jgi:hypothetical protein